MTDRILLAIAAFCALVCALGLLRLISFQSRRYCPGLRLRGREWLLPFNWLSSIGCGYDLTGHLQYTKHALPITCSECGRAIERRRQMRRRPRRWRMVTVGGLAALGFSFALVQRFFAQTHWDDDLPTWALIAIHDWCGDSTPVGVREELRRRRSEMTDAQVMALFPMFISDLRSDAVMWNAGSAAYLLQKSDSPQLQDALREALDSEDWQQRQYAAQILHQRYLCRPDCRSRGGAARWKSRDSG